MAILDFSGALLAPPGRGTGFAAAGIAAVDALPTRARRPAHRTSRPFPGDPIVLRENAKTSARMVAVAGTARAMPSLVDERVGRIERMATLAMGLPSIQCRDGISTQRVDSSGDRLQMCRAMLVGDRLDTRPGRTAVRSDVVDLKIIGQRAAEESPRHAGGTLLPTVQPEDGVTVLVKAAEPGPASGLLLDFGHEPSPVVASDEPAVRTTVM